MASEFERSYSAAVRAARLTLLLNLLLCLSKLVTGWFGNSFALMADGVNNLTDVGVSAALYLGMGLARRPADENHPYGHGRIEQELTRFVSLAVLVTGGGIIWEAIKRLTGEHGPEPDLVVLVVASLSIFVKLFMYVYQNRAARATGSTALAADAMNHKTDVLATLCVVLGTAAVQVGGPRWVIADEIAAIAVGLLILVAASHEIYHASDELLDRVPPGRVTDNVRALACGYPGVQGVDLVTGRKSGMHYLIDMHLEVPSAMSVRDAHYLAHQVKDWVMAAMPEILDVTVHVEPEDQSWKT